MAPVLFAVLGCVKNGGGVCTNEYSFTYKMGGPATYEEMDEGLGSCDL